MIVFVDNESAKGYESPWGERLMAARVRIKYRLEDLTNQPCLIVRYNKVTGALLRHLEVKAVFISGSSTDPDQYDKAEQAGLFAALREEAWPVFGFCGGLQTLAESYGVAVERIGKLAPTEEDPNPNFAPGYQKELGYSPVRITAPHPLLDGLGDAPIFRHAHSWEVKQIPPQFSLYASTAVTPIQLLIQYHLPIVGTQFHPEYWTEEHPDGRRLIENFCRWARLLSDRGQ
ncbi:MAG: hypothetical protein KDE47_00680 [Caldilineaceae bacterium]|nr:hypothetical protein [Caldilineaceae bacterium]